MLTTAQIKWVQNELEGTSFTEEEVIEKLNIEFNLSLDVRDITEDDWAKIEDVVTFCGMCNYWVDTKSADCPSGYDSVDCEMLSYDECYEHEDDDDE
mgnify:FL=1